MIKSVQNSKIIWDFELNYEIMCSSTCMIEKAIFSHQLLQNLDSLPLIRNCRLQRSLFLLVVSMIYLCQLVYLKNNFLELSLNLPLSKQGHKNG